LAHSCRASMKSRTPGRMRSPPDSL
jgi:hypothetical protein